MNFSQWLENVDEIENSIFNLAQSIFGRCQDKAIGAKCESGGRYFTYVYFPEPNYVNLSFSWGYGARQRFSAKDEFGAARELQPGTMEGINKYRKFLKGLHDLGVGVSYHALGDRRANLYRKILAQSGFVLDRDIWRPNAV